MTGAAIQLHGGIGFTWEADVHWLYKRAQLDSALLGSAGAHRARIALLAGARARRRDGLTSAFASRLHRATGMYGHRTDDSATSASSAQRDEPDSPTEMKRALLVRCAQAHGHRVQGGQPHRLGGRADVLRHPRAVPGAPGAGVADRPRGRAHGAVADRQHRGLAPRARPRTSSPTRSATCRTAAGRPPSSSSSASSARCGPPRPTSARSRAPRTRSTRSARAGPYGSCARSRSRSRS